MVSRSLAVLLVVAGLLAAAVTAPLASAHPVGGGTACSAPTLSGPESAKVGDNYTVTGCGFAPNSMVSVEITEGGGCCLAQQVYVGDDGSFEYTSNAWAAGSYRVRAAVMMRKGWTVVASWAFMAS